MPKRPLSEIRRPAGISEKHFAQIEDVVIEIKKILIQQYSDALGARFQDIDRESVRGIVEHIIETRQVLVPPSLAIADIISHLALTIVSVPDLEKYFNMPNVTDLLIRGDDLYVETSTEGKWLAGKVNPERIEEWVRQIAIGENREFNLDTPTVNTYFQGMRISAVKPPVADRLSVAIRLHRLQDVSLSQFANDEQLAELLAEAVLRRLNIVIIGAAGSGKSTLLQALARKIPDNEFPIVIEDVRELKLHHPAAVAWVAQSAFSKRDEKLTIADLVEMALRQNPDRIILQEILGREAIDLLDAAGTGHDGFLTTLHANNPKQAIVRLATKMTQARPEGASTYHDQIYDCVDLIIQLRKQVTHSEVRREIDAIYELGDGKLRCLYTHQRGLSLAARQHPKWGMSDAT